MEALSKRSRFAGPILALSCAASCGCGARTRLDLLETQTEGGGGSGGGAGGNTPPAPACAPGDSPTEVAQGAFLDATTLAVDDEAVYFHSTEGLARVDKRGGAPTLVVPQSRIQPIAAFILTQDELFYSYALGEEGVSRVSKAGGSFSVLEDPPAAQYLYRADGWIAYLYAGPDFARVGRVRESGAQFEIVATHTYHGSEIVADADAIYTYDDLGAVVRHEIATGSVTELVPPNQGVIAGLDDSYLYFDTGILARIPKKGGVRSYISDVGGRHLAFDGDDLYFSDTHAVRSVKASGGTSLVIAPGGGGFVEQIAVDAACVYWFEDIEGSTTGRIMRAPKQR